jgi:DNA-binding CsgD family transcriptional regulator
LFRGVHPCGAHPNGQHLNNTEISQRLGISVNRVKTLIHQACIKLGAHNRTEAILFALRRGEIKFDELYSLDELAEFFWALCPDMLRSMTRLVHEELEHGHPPWNDRQTIRKDKRQDTILTKSEQDVLALVGRGLTNKEIADTLYISISAVRTLLYRAYTKLGTRKRTDAVMLALRRGEISISEMFSLGELAEYLAPLGAETLEEIAQVMNQKLGQGPIPTGS